MRMFCETVIILLGLMPAMYVGTLLFGTMMVDSINSHINNFVYV